MPISIVSNTCKLNYKILKFNDKLAIVNSFLIWLKRIKSSIKVFEDTLVEVTNSQKAPTENSWRLFIIFIHKVLLKVSFEYKYKYKQTKLPKREFCFMIRICHYQIKKLSA